MEINPFVQRLFLARESTGVDSFRKAVRPRDRHGPEATETG